MSSKTLRRNELKKGDKVFGRYTITQTHSQRPGICHKVVYEN